MWALCSDLSRGMTGYLAKLEGERVYFTGHSKRVSSKMFLSVSQLIALKVCWSHECQLIVFSDHLGRQYCDYFSIFCYTIQMGVVIVDRQHTTLSYITFGSLLQQRFLRYHPIRTT